MAEDQHGRNKDLVFRFPARYVFAIDELRFHLTPADSQPNLDLSPYVPPSIRSMTVLALCNHKGGTGKTTSAIHLAAALGLSGYRVLVIDDNATNRLILHETLSRIIPTGKVIRIPFHRVP